AGVGEGVEAGTSLASVENLLFLVRLRVDARDAAPLPIRPADGLRMEAVAAGLAGQRGDHRDGDPILGEALMSAPLLVFFVLALIAILGAISLIVQKHPIHSALSLIVVMVALAGLYLLMGAEFVAAVQIIVYGGAIMVLFVFVIMLLNAGVEERTNFSKLATFGGIPLALALLVGIAAAVVGGQGAVQAAA